MFKKNLPFWLITSAAVIGIILPLLIQDGMFMDAELYTSVAHNLSEGIGTFWMPQFSLHNMSGIASFHEQPPLGLGLLALFYKVFGDSLYTERFYTFITLCLTAILINSLWKKVCTDENLRKMGWLPIIIWITVPDCMWSYTQNMLENTMGVFTLAAGLCAFKALKSSGINIVQCLLSGMFVFMATLSKGVPGFFTLSMPFLYWAITKKTDFKRMFIATAIMVAVPLIIYGLLIIVPESREGLSLYFFNRLLGRINYQHSVSTRWNIVFHLLAQLIPQFCLMALVLLLTGLKKAKEMLAAAPDKSMILFFAFTGLAGSIPIMLTLVQSGWYIVPSYPFFAISIGLFVGILIQKYVNRINTSGKAYKVFLAFSALMLVSALTFGFSKAGKVKRAHEMLHDVHIVGKIIPRYGVVSIPEDMWDNFELQCYFIRYYNISLEPEKKLQYYLQESNDAKGPPAGYTKLDAGLEKYDLFVKK